MSCKRTILHVDDDPQFTRIVSGRLTELGYGVTSLNDPRQALEQLNRSHQRLVLLDIDMPHVNGLELLRQIQAECSGTQVIMLTGIVTVQSIMQSYRWGAEFCIFKPIVHMEPLLDAIENTFRKIDHWWNALNYLSREKRGTITAAERPSEVAELRTANSVSKSILSELQR